MNQKFNRTSESRKEGRIQLSSSHILKKSKEKKLM
jgi:hypothetical protein